MTVESVQVAFNTTHRRPANLRVALISPSGTRSILVWPFSGIRPLTGSTTAGFGSERMLSNAFLDENAQGTWRLEVVDVTAASGTSPSQLVSWSLRVTGR
jgi:subtilisin-like proprotein convertase family protein